MKESGTSTPILDKARATRSGLTGHFMKDTGKMTKPTGEAD